MRSLTFFATLGLTALAAGGESVRVDLSYRTYRTWKIELPAESYTKVSGELPGGFAVELDGIKLLVDADGDGTLERSVEGKLDDSGVRTAVLVCRRGEGRPVGFRLRDKGDGWRHAPAGAAIGKLGETRLQLIDQDNDGRFDGYGSDAMIVGTGARAQFLSDVVSVGGALYSIDVAADGSFLEYASFQGESGVLDLTSDMEAEAKLLTAVVKSADGRRSFDLASAPNGLVIPAGEYNIHSGKFGLGKAIVQVDPAATAPLIVTAEGACTLNWGGPVRAEFAYQRQGDEIAFHPDAVWYYGAAGEQYVGWQPIGKSPEFTVRSEATGAELARAVFAGST